MLLFETNKKLADFISSQKKIGKSIGFVPTMGALHEGHISLLNKANQYCDVSVCSIFINPTQFNETKDLDSYPRTLKEDKKLLEKAGAKGLFYPSVSEIYPQGLKSNLSIDLGGLENPMEGKFRPGHFEGVIQVVNRLLDIVQPDSLFMGQKDFQQFSVIRRMLQFVHTSVRLIMGTTKREADGLAMSSRNRRLSPANRRKAPVIFQTLKNAKEECDFLPIEQVLKNAVNHLSIPGFRLEYFEIVDGFTLQSINSLDESEVVVACLAIWAGDVRLIDNHIIKGEDLLVLQELVS